MKDSLRYRWSAFLAITIGMMLIVASLLFSPPFTFAAMNLLPNPGFENGKTGWSESQKSNFTFAITTTIVHSGSYAAALTSSGSTTSKFISQTITGILAGNKYSASGYGYISDVNVSRIVLRIAWYSNADCSGSQLSTVDSNVITTLGTFQPMTITSKIAPSTAQCARIRAELDPISTVAAIAFFDDLSFSKDDPATPTLTPTNTSTLTPINTPTNAPTPTATRMAEKLLITEVLYDGTQAEEGDEFIEIANQLTKTVDLSGYKVGDEETKGSGESMYVFPSNTFIVPNSTLVIARNATQFRKRFGFDPNFEVVTTGALTDTLTVPNLSKYTTWASGALSLSNDGDEILLLGPNDELVDSVAWSNGSFTAIGLRGHASAPEPKSLQRYGAYDTNSMTYDFLKDVPSPGALVSALSALPSRPKPGATMPNGMFAYWGDLHSHSTVSDGSGPPRMAFDLARMNGLHFFGLTDHDTTMTQADWDEMGQAAKDASRDGAFIGLRGYEYSNSKGHINVFGTSTWVAHTDPSYSSLSAFYAWLGSQRTAIAQFNHPDWKYGGDFDNFAFNAAALDKIALQEVGNNGDAYVRFESQYPSSLSKLWHVAPTNNSDHHGLNWGNDSAHRVGIIAPALTQANLFDAFHARRVFATEDSNLAIALQSNDAWMGSTITARTTLTFTVTVVDPDAEPIQLFLYDNGKVVRSQSFPNSSVTWSVSTTGGSSHFYFVRAIQADGDIAYTSPIWTDATRLPTPVLPTNTPAPKRWDLGPVSVDTARTTGALRYVDLEACVTVPPGIFSDNYIFVQDNTGGVKVYLSSKRGDFPVIGLADRVAVRGKVPLIAGEREIQIEDVGTIQVRGKCNPVEPLRLKTIEINQANEGRLVEVRGNVVSYERGEFVINDGSGEALIYLDVTTHIPLPSLARGRTVRAMGIVSRAHGKFAVLPRFQSDLEFGTGPSSTSTRTPTRTPARFPTSTSTPILTHTPTITPRVSLNQIDSPPAGIFVASESPAVPQWVNVQTLAIAGATTSATAGLGFCALALLLWRRK